METRKVPPNRVSYIPKEGPVLSKKLNEFGIVPTLSRLSTDPLEAYLQEAVITAKNRKEYMENINKNSKSAKPSLVSVNKDIGARAHCHSAPRDYVKYPAIKEELVKQSDNYITIKTEPSKTIRSASKKEHHTSRNRVDILNAESRRLLNKDLATLTLHGGRQDRGSSRGDSPDVSNDRRRHDRSAHHAISQASPVRDDMNKTERLKLKDELGVKHRTREDGSRMHMHNRRSSKEDSNRKSGNRSAIDDLPKYERAASTVHKDLSAATKPKVRSATKDDVGRVHVRSAAKTESTISKRTQPKVDYSPSLRCQSKERSTKLHERATKEDYHRRRDYSDRERSIASARRPDSSRNEVVKLFSRSAMKEEERLNREARATDTDYL